MAASERVKTVQKTAGVFSWCQWHWYTFVVPLCETEMYKSINFIPSQCINRAELHKPFRYSSIFPGLKTVCISILWYRHPKLSATRSASFLMKVGLKNMNESSCDLLHTVTFSGSIVLFLLWNFNFLNYVLNVFWYYGDGKSHELWNDSCWQTL